MPDSLGDSPEKQRSPGRLDNLQEGNLKGARPGCLHVPEDKMAGKKIGLAVQRALTGNCTESFDWKWQVTQEDDKNFVRFCREKIRRAKAQQELNMATAI